MTDLVGVGPQVTIGVRTGAATASTCPIVVASLVAGNITVNCNGSNYVVTPTAIGTDAPSGHVKFGLQAGFVGSTTMTGLSAGTRYTFTVTQGSNSVTGTFLSAPTSNSDFAFYAGSCDCNNAFNSDLFNSWIRWGCWKGIRQYMQTSGNLPVAGILFVDDHGYVSKMNVDDTGGTGHITASEPNAATVAADVYQYDYAIAYLCNLGLLQNTDINDIAKAQVRFGRDEDRVWCAQNLNYWPQWGDWEFANDIGWDKPTQTTMATGGRKEKYDAGKAVWDRIMGPLQPNAFGQKLAGTNLWSMTIGPVTIVAPDYISNGDGTFSSFVGADKSLYSQTTFYGTTQIDAVLTELNTTAPFKILALGHSIRYPATAPSSEVYSGAQHPIANSTPTEYDRLVTKTNPAGAEPKSIMHNPRTNGTEGMLVALHGDYHHQQAYLHTKTGGANQANEYFYSITSGAINGSAGFTTPLVTGDNPLGYELADYINPRTGSPMSCTRVEVYASRSPQEIHYVLLDGGEGGDLVEVKRYRFLARSSNAVFPVDWTFPTRVHSGRIA